MNVNGHNLAPAIAFIEVAMSQGLAIDITTAKRFVRVLNELGQSVRQEEPDIYMEPYEGGTITIEVPAIPISSFCEHHLLPWVGSVSIMYIPGEYVVGLSKFTRLAQYCARGLTLQEEVTNRIFNTLTKKVMPLGLEVEIEATHTCICSRGVKSPNMPVATRISSGLLSGI